jgi:hypothetical protein
MFILNPCQTQIGSRVNFFFAKESYQRVQKSHGSDMATIINRELSKKNLLESDPNKDSQILKFFPYESVKLII